MENLDRESLKEDDVSFVVKMIYLTISAAGIPGNIMVIVVIIISTRMRKKIFNQFILNQSLLHLGVCTSALLLQVRSSTCLCWISLNRI